MDPNVKKYRAYTRWLESLPKASQVGERREPGSLCVEPVFKIEGYGARLFTLGCTGAETE